MLRTVFQTFPSSTSHSELGRIGEVSPVFLHKHHYLTCAALNGSKHIEFLLQHNLIQRTPSEDLSRVYSRALLWASAKRLDPKALKQYVKIAFTVGEEKEEEIQLLEQTDGKAVAKVLKIPELAAEIERAVRQVELSVKAKEELQGEKQNIESAKEKDQKS